MRDCFDSLNEKLLKEGLRKLGINFITASVVGGFISHVANMTPVDIALMISVGTIGLCLILFGIYKVE